MKVLPVKGTNHVYTCNVFLCLGDWNRINDVNTLIDVGNDPSIIAAIEAAPSGIGKKRVEQIILTHTHSDHTGILPLIRQAFAPVVCAFSTYSEGADRVLQDGDRIKVADRTCEVIHMPGHSEDSIALYCQDEGLLFVGDAPVIIQNGNGSYEKRFVDKLRALCRRNVQAIYFGHGGPLTENAKPLLMASLNRMEGKRPPRVGECEGKPAHGPAEASISGTRKAHTP